MLFPLVAVLALLVASTGLEHTLDFDVPRSGPRCIRVDVGDTVKFEWEEYHNLYSIAAETQYTNCDFTGATLLNGHAGGWPNVGVIAGPFSSAGDRFYACSKICSWFGHKVRVCVGTACGCAEGQVYVGQTAPTAAPIATPTPDATAAPTTAPAAAPTAAPTPSALATPAAAAPTAAPAAAPGAPPAEPTPAPTAAAAAEEVQPGRDSSSSGAESKFTAALLIVALRGVWLATCFDR